MFAALGTKVTVAVMLDFRPRGRGAEIPPAPDIIPVFRRGSDRGRCRLAGTATTLASGNRFQPSTVMYSAGRQINRPPRPAQRRTRGAGRGRISDRPFQTKVDHIYAAGDVIGFPPLAATSMEQGGWLPTRAFMTKRRTTELFIRYLFDSRGVLRRRHRVWN